MSNKPKKRVVLGRLDSLEKVIEYLSDLDNDVFNITTYLDTFPRSFEQSAQPTIQRNTFAFWRDLDDEKFYLLKDFRGTTKKVELT